ncbi:unnamed protein product, partial [Choristocarpus tenellus]
CSTCPERKSCASGSTTSTWSSCQAGYYCPEGTPSPDVFPCDPGTYSNRSNLASADECTICPPSFYCVGGSSSVDGPCFAGYYCPPGTGSATENACPAGTYSPSTSLYLESQCVDCPSGYYCPEASTSAEPCPAGTYTSYNNTEDAGPGSYPSCTECPAGYYCEETSREPTECGTGKRFHSDYGADACSMCEAGYYCGGNTTQTSNMYSGGGDWDSSEDDEGKCFNGTYCPAGMARAPGEDSCMAGYYCPVAAANPYACPSGTYNPHGGMDDATDCQISPAGYYTIEAATNSTGSCSPGYYCPAGSTGPEQVPCPTRFYRSQYGATDLDDCALCVSGGYCPSGSTEPTLCPRGYYCVTG